MLARKFSFSKRINRDLLNSVECSLCSLASVKNNFNFYTKKKSDQKRGNFCFHVTKLNSESCVNAVLHKNISSLLCEEYIFISILYTSIIVIIIIIKDP